MKFDSKKWDAYVQEEGAENLARKLINHPLGSYYRNTIDKETLLICSKYDIESQNFNPFKHKSYSTIFMLLGLNIEDFILPEPVQTVTGIEALRALCDGKVLRDIETDALYKIENNIYLIYHGNDVWDKAHIDIYFLLIDKFEVMPCQQ